MEETEQLAIVSDPLLACCLCKRLLRDAVQLTCLHNCCQQCFSSAASSSSSQEMHCGSCGSSTGSGDVRPNSFVDCKVRRYTLIAESRVCGVCKGNGEAEKPALVWCSTCRHSLCGDCISGHRQLYRQHATQSLEELVNLEAVCSLPSASACQLHKKPLDVACVNCEQAKCISCWAECQDKSHKMHVAGKETFDNYVGQFIERLRCLEKELLQKLDLLDQPQKVVRATKAARDRHLEQITQRKRRIVDAVEIAYQEIEYSTRNAYDELIEEGDVAVAGAERIASHLSDATSYVQRLLESDDKCEILNQQKIVRERLSILSTEVDVLSEKLATTSRAVSLESSIPDDLENVIRQWIGMPTTVSSSTFGAASACVQLPVECCDVALTQDGRLLLAARQHGLLEFSSSSAQELSRWQPKQSNGRDDCVLAVAALSDGRAAVSVHFAQLVLLLRRCETVDSSSSSQGAAAAAWTEELRLEQLPWPPHRLAAHGDMLAVTESRRDEQHQNKWVPGRRLQLLSLSSGRQLSSAERQREYSIRSLAVSARAVVTGSREQVQLGSGGRAVQVLDAHSLRDGDERLWRHELSSSDEELLLGVCTDSGGGCLYAAVRRRDLSSGRVCALSLADGSELRNVALSFSASASPQLLLAWLSLSVGGAAEQQQEPGSSSSSSRRELQLAVLCEDSTSKEWKTVTVHSSSSSQQ